MISVIIPVYNAEKSIVAALTSVKAQTWPGPFEVILIDDGSTDTSVGLIEQFRHENPQMDIKMIRQRNQGVSTARNAGLALAKGDWIALLDADDEWLPQKTARQMKCAEEDSSLDFISCRRVNQKLLFPYHAGENGLAEINFRKILFRNEIQPSTVIFKKKILGNAGFFREHQRYAEDHNFWLRISLHNRMCILDEEHVNAGGGKRSFGISGLSANLPAMEKGFQSNLREMYSAGRLSVVGYALYVIFYRLEYLVRLGRNFYYKLKGR